MTFEAIPAGDLTARQRALNESYIQSVKEWTAAKKEGSTSEPPPKRPAVIVGQKVKGRAMAENMAALLQERWNKQRASSATASETKEAPSSAEATEKKPQATAGH